MDSSIALFSNQGSPFLEASSFLSHYHPSRPQQLSQRDRSTALSPSRLQQRNRPVSSKEEETSSPLLPSFLPDSSCQGAKPDSDSANPYNESWPSTERSSSSLSPEGEKALTQEQTVNTKAPASSKFQGSMAFSDSGSVIARYIERFRYGQPTNRSERWAPNSNFTPFGWLGRSSPSEDSGRHEGRPRSFSPLLDHSASGDSPDSSSPDPDTASLQERAARLLLRSVSPSSSCRHVSSEGLGSTPTNADTDLMGQARKPLAELQQKEDDILFQWRLRRKMEEASKAVAVLPSVGWRTQCTESAYLSPSMMGGEALKSPKPTSWRNKDREVLQTSEAQPVQTLYEHPCCCVNHTRMGPASQVALEGTSFSDQNVMLRSSEPNREQRAKEPVSREDPVPTCQGFLPLPRPAGTTKPLDLSPSDHSQRTAPPVQKVSSEPRERQRPFRLEHERPKAARDSAKPSVSPRKHVQQVLGEVVAERLFSSPASPAPRRAKLKRSSKKQGPKGSPLNTVATPSYPELLDMAAQLLEQAEESDGTDFEDDPLLQVLRSQRDLLRQKLRAVDTRVIQLEGNPSDHNFSHP